VKALLIIFLTYVFLLGYTMDEPLFEAMNMAYVYGCTKHDGNFITCLQEGRELKRELKEMFGDGRISN
jgi:hypothetical protein